MKQKLKIFINYKENNKNGCYLGWKKIIDKKKYLRF